MGADALVELVPSRGKTTGCRLNQLIEALPPLSTLLSLQPVLSEPGRKNKISVLFDGGIRHGADIFNALALGADLCVDWQILFCGVWDDKRGRGGGRDCD